MGKYSFSNPQQKQERQQRQTVSPLMRGAGCILMIVVPILAYLTAPLFIRLWSSTGMPLPPDWFGAPTIHPLLWKLQGLVPILNFLRRQNNLEVYLAFTIAVTLIVAGLMIVVYGYIYNIVGPPKYGPHDEPPIRKKVKAYKR